MLLLSPVAYFTDPQTSIPGAETYRYYAELASNELDEEGISERFIIADVLVAINCEAAVRQVLDDKGLLHEWGIVAIWQPEEESPF